MSAAFPVFAGARAPADAAAYRREVLRQALLMQALLQPLAGDAPAPVLQGWLRESGDRAARGLSAYRANAGAIAERALVAAFPTVFALVGEEAAGALVRAYVRAHPPRRGDLAFLGEALPGFIAADPRLAGEPYLADVARLDAALARAESAADVTPDRDSLMRLAAADPATLRLRLAAGSRRVESAHPIVSIHAAHQAPPGAARDAAFAAARAALAAGQGETAWVWRDDSGRPRVASLPAPAARLLQASLDGASLGDALAAAGPALDFAGWLRLGLEQQGLAGVDDHPAG